VIESNSSSGARTASTLKVAACRVKFFSIGP
jgi:hypothetical protein